MSLKFIVHGVEVTATDAVEAAKLIRELGAQNAAAPVARPAAAPNGKPRLNLRERPRIKIKKRGYRGPFNVTRGAVAFLTAIKEAGRDGVTAESLMEPLQNTHVKGVGSRIGMINPYLARLGFPAESVYDNERTRKGRRFTGRAALDAALEAARKAMR
jgi:hypothetical protein